MISKFIENLNLKRKTNKAEKWWGSGIVPWRWRLWLSLSVRLRREILKRKSGFCFGGFDLIGISPMSFMRENYDLGLKVGTEQSIYRHWNYAGKEIVNTVQSYYNFQIQRERERECVTRVLSYHNLVHNLLFAIFDHLWFELKLKF